VRRPLVAGNAKMYLDRSSVRALLGEIRSALDREPAFAETAYCPPYTLLEEARVALARSSVALGAQDVHWEESGPYTGEVSGPMLAEAGCRYVIVGHSERRRHLGETDLMIGAKAKAAVGAGLVPILCIGETESERDSGDMKTVLAGQIGRSLSGAAAVYTPERLVVAYEPVWAIGTGRSATVSQVREAHAWVRAQLALILGGATADGVRILYGGSVKPQNAAEILECPGVDGALVGGASLESSSFLAIVRAAAGPGASDPPR
jgi:triosephosphate isomerase (TIM)